LRSFGIALKAVGACAPNSNIVTYTVTITNKGPVAFVPPPIPASFISMWDEHKDADWGAFEIGGGTPPLAAHASTKVVVGVAYYAADPAHMTQYPTHPFQSWITRWWNPSAPTTSPNYYGPVAEGPLVNVPAPKNCP
jgi:hypothetical protein